MTITLTIKPYGPMAWSGTPSETIDHRAEVLNRAADVFYAESGWDSGDGSTHVELAAAALHWEMWNQGAHPVGDSFSWRTDSNAADEMGALQAVVTDDEWIAIDALARKRIAYRLIAELLKQAIDDEKVVPLADFLPAEIKGLLDLVA